MNGARSVFVAVAVGALVGCTAISGIGDLHIGASAMDPLDGGSSPSGDADPSPGLRGWAFRRPITLASDLTTSPATYPVLVRLPESFDYTKAAPDGADLRFSRSDKHEDELPYWIERWAPQEESSIWVLVSEPPTGSSVLHLFYGNPNAGAVSAFDKVFSRVQKTAGGGAGSFVAAGDIDVDWFELSAGDTLTLATGTPLRIQARRIIIEGTIDGNAKGYAGGITSTEAEGKGPGGGKALANSGAGGGGHGGAGGAGGADGADTPGAAGVVNGSDRTIDMGSGGGVGWASKPGGAGGGAVSLLGWSTRVRGTISVNGQAGTAAGTALGAGGGAGGGILIAGSLLDLTTGTLVANGGDGGSTSAASADGGGGGGGGRINLHARTSGRYAPPTTLSLGFGAGGAGAGTSAPGQPGAAGALHTGSEASLAPGIEAGVGAEAGF